MCVFSVWKPMLLQSAWNAGLPSPSVSVQETAGSLGEVQDNLKPGWTVHVTHDNRLYYCKYVEKSIELSENTSTIILYFLSRFNRKPGLITVLNN